MIQETLTVLHVLRYFGLIFHTAKIYFFDSPVHFKFLFFYKSTY